ncbi:MAG: CBS domain-containing protein [Firmicutes bacterium]|nr:CBS domain-containing protein [Bacillota bacterium]
MKNNADRFLDAYCRIEQALRRIVAPDRFLKFYELVKSACRIEPLVKQYRVDLLELGELRNAIVHNRTDGRIIAVPDDEAVAVIERIAAHLLEPPRVLPLFKKKVVTVKDEDPLSKAVKLLYHHSYSQLPVTDEGVIVALLTMNTISRWLGKTMENKDPLEDTTVAEVLKYTEHGDNFRLVGAKTTLFEIQDLFYRFYQRGKKLDAVLITHGGSAEEPLLGIVTMRDLPLVQKELAYN